MTDHLSKIYERLQRVPAVVDVGHTDEALEHTTVRVTDRYARFLTRRGGKDVVIMLPYRSGGSSGGGKWGVHMLLSMSLNLVENMIEAGVPRHVALGFLPHELYREACPHASTVTPDGAKEELLELIRDHGPEGISARNAVNEIVDRYTGDALELSALKRVVKSAEKILLERGDIAIGHNLHYVATREDADTSSDCEDLSDPPTNL